MSLAVRIRELNTGLCSQNILRKEEFDSIYEPAVYGMSDDHNIDLLFRC